MDTDVPPALRPTLRSFKQALIDTVDTTLLCTNPNPSVIQSQLSGMLHANQPVKPFVPEKGPPWPETEVGDYGGNLTISVKPIPAQPNLSSIQIGFALECGDDNILLLYRRTSTGWRQELTFDNPDISSVGDAIGDFFEFALVPAGPSKPYLVATAHGNPWCTSRMSAFHIDLLSPAQNGQPQTRVDHLDEYYSRGDFTPTLRTTHDGFTLRAAVDSHDFDNLFTRTAIFRFNTLSGRLERIQPIASSARDFVDAWLGLPWDQAAQWSGSPDPALHRVLDRFNYSIQRDKGIPNLEFGPTRVCASRPNEFQIEMEISEGPKLEIESKLYARVQQNPNSFTMLSITPQPDPTCKGPNLMKASK
jgi:hypothetical protein